jgi:hypothetical protein
LNASKKGGDPSNVDVKKGHDGETGTGSARWIRKRTQRSVTTRQGRMQGESVQGAHRGETGFKRR